MTDEMSMAELGAAIDRGEREPAEAVARLAAPVYPRFFGLDDGGSFVWELENGRWCWVDDPHHAVHQIRTFEPERYVTKYGTPTPVTSAPTVDPVPFTVHHLDGTKTVTGVTERDREDKP